MDKITAQAWLCQRATFHWFVTHEIAMLNQAEMRRLVDLQHRGYLLLKWMAKAVSEKFVNFETAHDYLTLFEAAEGWIVAHYWSIPESARPPRDDLPAFYAFFTTYLKNSFDRVSNPGKQIYSPDAHCFCPMCSWLVDAPNLRTKKVRSTDKRRAEKMQVNTLLNLAAALRINVSGKVISELLHDRQISRDASLLAYGCDLLEREKGIANGPAVLALWRGFAWNEFGAPIHGFRLKAKLIVDAENRLLELLEKIGQNAMVPNVVGKTSTPDPG